MRASFLTPGSRPSTVVTVRDSRASSSTVKPSPRSGSGPWPVRTRMSSCVSGPLLYTRNRTSPDGSSRSDLTRKSRTETLTAGSFWLLSIPAQPVAAPTASRPTMAGSRLRLHRASDGCRITFVIGRGMPWLEPRQQEERAQARQTRGAMRVAAIDLGTNSTRLLVADVAGGRVAEVERSLRITRLGEGVDERRRLLPLPIARVRNVLSDFRRTIERLGAGRTLAVATSARRDP